MIDPKGSRVIQNLSRRVMKAVVVALAAVSSLEARATQPAEAPAPTDDPATPALEASAPRADVPSEEAPAPAASPSDAAAPSDAAPSDSVGAPAAVAPYAPLLAASLLAPEAMGPRVSVGGFADVTLESIEDFATTNVTIGQLVVHANAVMPAGFGAFTEVTVNSTPEWQTRVERLFLSYEPSDALKLTVGRQHLPVTWWNSTFHHGLWLQTTARRPMMIGFNDAFIPNHFVGVFADGQLPVARALGIRYHLGLSGGGDDHKHTTDSYLETPRASYSGGLAFEPRVIQHLRVGAVAYLDPHRMRDGQMVSETLVGAHVAYTAERPEIIAEWVEVRHDIASAHYASPAAYAQVAWRFKELGGRLKPYARAERMRIDASDPTLASAVSQDLFTVGLRVDPIAWFAIKVEGARRVPVGGTASNEGLLQVSASW